MILQAALNGARQRGEHAALPLTPAAIVEDAVAAVRAGANEVHLHIRDEAGAETLCAEVVDVLIGAMRRALPGTLLGISTGLWIEGNHGLTAARIGQWRNLPDYASLNMGEAGAVTVAAALRARGIGLELGLADEGDVEAALSAGLTDQALRILIEVMEPEPTRALSIAEAMLARLQAAGVAKPLLLHGMDATVWPLFDLAATHGLSQRLGLEDGASLPDGTIAGNNAAIIMAGRQRNGTQR
jgi:uncharacterized protein (DUF849 family)